MVDFEFHKARKSLRKDGGEPYVGIFKNELVFCIYNPFLEHKNKKGFLNYPCFLRSEWGQLLGKLDSLTKF